MATLNVEQSALRDGRFKRLAELCGFADADHARGKLEHVWNECLERGQHTLPAWLVETHLGAGAAGALVTCELAKYVDDSTSTSPADPARLVYINGTRGKIEWLAKKRKSKQKAGKARAAQAQRDGGRFASSPPARAGDVLGEGSSPSASASASSQGKKRKTPPAPMPDGWAPNDAHRRIALEKGRDLAAEEQEFRDKAAARGYQYADWDAAFRTWLRNERYRPAVVQRQGQQRQGSLAVVEPIRNLKTIEL